MNNPEFSLRLKNVIYSALKISAGCQIVPRVDGHVELYSNGAAEVITNNEFSLATDLLKEVDKKYLQANGIIPPFNALYIIGMLPLLENLLADRLEKMEVKAVFIKGDTGGCSYWRCDEPTKALNEKYKDQIYIESVHGVSYETLLPFDVIILQRGLFGSDTTGIMVIIERLKQAGKKIVYEIDDDLSTLLADNNCFYHVTEEEVKGINWIKEKADAIFTTTKYLADKTGYPKKCYIIPNSINFHNLEEKPRRGGEDNILKVLWHGGDSHGRDLNWISKPLIQLIQKRETLNAKINKDIIFGIMGYLPDWLHQFMEYKFPASVGKGEYDSDLRTKVREITIKGRAGVKYIKGVKPSEFHNYLIHLAPDICYCPLLPDVEFNQAKSNIKVLESIMAGAATVVTDTGPYKVDVPDDVVIKTRTPEQMCGAIQSLILNENKRKDLIAKGQEWLYSNFDLAKNCDLWLNALKEIKNGDIN